MKTYNLFFKYEDSNFREHKNLSSKNIRKLIKDEMKLNHNIDYNMTQGNLFNSLNQNKRPYNQLLNYFFKVEYYNDNCLKTKRV